MLVKKFSSMFNCKLFELKNLDSNKNVNNLILVAL